MKLVGVVGALACAGIVISTFKGDGPQLPFPLVLLAAAAAVPLLIIAGVRANRQPRPKGLRGLWDQLRERLPMWAIVLAAFAFYCSFLLGIITLATGPGGAPEIRDGKYVLVQRNKVTEVTREVHDRAAVQWERIFGCFGVGLHTGGAVLLALTRPAVRAA